MLTEYYVIFRVNIIVYMKVPLIQLLKDFKCGISNSSGRSQGNIDFVQVLVKNRIVGLSETSSKSLLGSKTHE